MRLLAIGAILWSLSGPPGLAADAQQSPTFTASEFDFDFDFAVPEPEPYDIGGYLELRIGYLRLDPDSVLHRLAFLDQGDLTARWRFLSRLQLEVSYEHGSSKLLVRTNSDLVRELGDWDQRTSLHEAYWRWSPQHTLALEAGKKVMKWGKGYAWNPIAFVERPKDPDEPDLPREGFVLLVSDLVRSYPGKLQTLGLTAVLIPATSSLNSDFGAGDGMNLAGKVYFLFADTDLDFMVLTGPSQPTRYGMDFARNLSPNLEVHGEWAYTPDGDHTTVGADGAVLTTRGRIHQAILGLRYLTPGDLTYILEYQHNGDGFSRAELADFYAFITEAAQVYESTGDDALLRRARQLNQELFSDHPLGRRYIYLRASQKEPRDVLYLTTSATLQCNLDDRSFSLIPEAVYTGFSNWELRARLFILRGGSHTEFGEKPSQHRLELTARRFF